MRRGWRGKFARIYPWDCRVSGCAQPHRSKGFCRGHLSAFERGRIDANGNPVPLECERCGKLYLARRSDQRFCPRCKWPRRGSGSGPRYETMEELFTKHREFVEALKQTGNVAEAGRRVAMPANRAWDVARRLGFRLRWGFDPKTLRKRLRREARFLEAK